MEYKINIPEGIDVQGLFGNYDANVRSVEKFTGTEMSLRDDVLTIRGRDPELAARIIARLIEALNNAPELDGFEGTLAEHAKAVDAASRRIAKSIVELNR